MMKEKLTTMLKIKKLTPLFLLLSSTIAFGQGEIPVDMFTGTPAVSIPIYTVSDHDISETVGIVYSASGVRLEEQKGIAGLGWNLQAGGAIYRQVRGLPDDYEGPGSPDTRKGWLYNNNATSAHNFSNSADLSTTTCTDETGAYTALHGYNYKQDTEPDIFYYSAGGISGAFVFDKDLNIRLIPYRDVKIEFTRHSQTNWINSFTITSNTGIKYKFFLPVQVTRSAHKIGTADVEFFKREFQQYDISLYNPGLTFHQEWKLTELQSPSGATLTYAYSTSATSVSVDTVRVGIRKLGPSSDLQNTDKYYIKNSMRSREIQSISSSTGEILSFEIGEVISKIKVRHKRRASTPLKEFLFDYQAPLDQDSTTGGFARVFLKSLTEVSASQCEKIPPYTFSYINVDFANNMCDLPSISSKAKDFWGYYNGKNSNTTFYPKVYVYPSESAAERIRVYPKANHTGSEYILPGADRMPDAASMQIGSLKMITYPSGGATVINYEPNDFYDAAAAQTFVGGGLRVKSIVTYDGVNAANNIVKTFEYKDGSGVSSGRLINKPIFVIPTLGYRDPNSSETRTHAQLLLEGQQSMYDHELVRTNYNLNQDIEGDVVAYGKVKVSRPGSGSAEFEYALPAVHGETSSGSWTATDNKFVRENGVCPAMGVVTGGGILSYPYASNPNFGYERGFLLKKTERDQSGDKVREITYTPQYIYKSGTSPYQVYGVSYDYYTYSGTSSPVYFFGKNYLLTDVAKVVSTESTTTYDANDVAKNVTTTQQYFYESSAHKLLTRSASTSIDGTVVTRRVKYPLDFGNIPPVSELTPSPDSYLLAIKNLQESFRNGIPVETVTSIQRSGDSDKTVSATLVKFSDFGVSGRVLPEEYLSLKVDQGITDFVPANKVTNGLDIEFTHDSRYDIDNTFLGFDQYDVPLTSVGKDRIYRSTHWGFKKSVPVVQATNALYNQFVFSNFETDSTQNTTGYEFTLTPASPNGPGRTGGKSASALVKLTKVLQKAAVNNYKLTFWFKKQPSGNDFNVKLKNTAGTTTYYDNTFNVTTASSDWEYVQKLVPMTGVPSTFLVEIQGVNIPGGSSPLIDDVAFYPENANLITYTYDIPFGQSSITDATASTVFSQFDLLGRQKFVLDQDKNIIQKKSYKFPGDQLPAFTASIGMDNPNSPQCPPGETCLYDYTAYTFTANDNNCISEGVTYEWKFGTGNWISGGKTSANGYTAPGTYTVSLRKSHPLYTSVESTITFTLTRRNLDGAALCAKGADIIECSTVTSSYECTAITETPTGLQTYFKVTNAVMNGNTYSDPADPITSYQWYRRNYGSETWSPVGSNQSTIMQNANLPLGYDIRCFVTTQTGRTGWTDFWTVTKELCN